MEPDGTLTTVTVPCQSFECHSGRVTDPTGQVGVFSGEDPPGDRHHGTLPDTSVCELYTCGGTSQPHTGGHCLVLYLQSPRVLEQILVPRVVLHSV